MVGVALGLLTPITATVGDLAESLIKRDLQLKDMGSVLPGHGGVLDRIDSMLITAPFVYLLFTAAAQLPTTPLPGA
jgi:phosphatidate cytidylyltransferase